MRQIGAERSKMGRLGTLETVRNITTKKSETTGQGKCRGRAKEVWRSVPSSPRPEQQLNVYLDPDTTLASAGPPHMSNSTPGRHVPHAPCWKCLCNPPVCPNSSTNTRFHMFFSFYYLSVCITQREPDSWLNHSVAFPTYPTTETCFFPHLLGPC